MEKRKIYILAPFRSEDVSKMKSVISEDFEIIHIEKAPGEEELKSILMNAEVIVGQPPIEYIEEAASKCPKLKFIQMPWAGTDMYTASTIKFPKERVMLANASGTYGMIISQYVVGMTLSLMLNFKTYHNQQQEKVWVKRGPIQSLDHAKVLIFGAGDIGSFVAKRLTGFEAHCIGVCKSTEKKRDYFHELCTLEDAKKYIPEADVIVCCIPYTDETKGYFNKYRLGLMKKSAVLVNVGRGNFVDCQALDEILKKGDIWGAALDVTDPEPLPESHPLWDNPRCIITPHTSGIAFGHLDATEDLLCEIVCDNLSNYCKGNPIRNMIYPDEK